MRATVSGESLSQALSKACAFGKGVSQTTELVELRLSKSGSLFVSTIAADCGARMMLPAKVEEIGALIVTRDQAARVAPVIPKHEDVILETTKTGNLAIEGPTSNIGLLRMKLDDYPGMQNPPGKEAWQKTEGFLDSFFRVEWAADKKKDNFCGAVYLSPEKIEAADGHKLARIEPGPLKTGTALVPADVLGRLRLLFFRDDDSLRIAVDGRKVWFHGSQEMPQAPQWLCYFTQVDGNFPDTSMMTFTEETGTYDPSGEPLPARREPNVSRDALLSAARRVYAASTETYMADANFQVAEDGMRIHSGREGDVRVSEIVPLPKDELLGCLRIGSQFFRLALERMPGDEIDVLWGASFVDKEIPLFELMSEDDSGKKYTFLIAPRK